MIFIIWYLIIIERETIMCSPRGEQQQKNEKKNYRKNKIK